MIGRSVCFRYAAHLTVLCEMAPKAVELDVGELVEVDDLVDLAHVEFALQ